MKLNLVFAVDNNGFEMMSVAVFSVIKNNQKHNLNFYLLHQNITKENILRIKKLEGKFSNVSVTPVLIEGKRFEGLKTNNIYVTTEAYFRYLAPEVLSREERALYMDFDMLCLADLGELYGINLSL